MIVSIAGAIFRFFRIESRFIRPRRKLRTEKFTRYRISLDGVVQGVGFRPFVKRLADRLELPGITFNTAGGLVIEIEANQNADALRFLESLKAEAPSASRIEHCVVEELAQVAPYSGFAILKSAARESSFTLVSADIATCAACLAEINDPGDRRFHYPFNNCTNCGPRYSITLSTPYDRSSTTMHRFPMCHACAWNTQIPPIAAFTLNPSPARRAAPNFRSISPSCRLSSQSAASSRSKVSADTNSPATHFAAMLWSACESESGAAVSRSPL